MIMKKIIRYFHVAVLGLLTLLSVSVFAQSDISEVDREDFWAEGRLPASQESQHMGLEDRRRYPGGRDEEDIQVQAVLPDPSRGAEAVESITRQPRQTEED